jgi:hypothetical protein
VLSALRRERKGLGRGPQSAKRQGFMELRSRGWSIMAAAREIGCPGLRAITGRSSTGLHMWARGRVSGTILGVDKRESTRSSADPVKALRAGTAEAVSGGVGREFDDEVSVEGCADALQ